MTRRGTTWSWIALMLAVLWPSLAAGAQVVETDGAAIALARDQGKILRLDAPAESVFVADPEIADVQVKSRRLIYVFGKKVGSTSLFAVGARESIVASARLDVTFDLARLRAALRDLDPAQPIEVRAVEDAVVLTGKVSAPRVAEDAQRVAERYAGADNVINRLDVTAPSQVNLRVRVAEVERSLSENIGVRWNELQFDLGGGDAFTFFGGGLTGLNDSFSGNLDIDGGAGSVDAVLDLLAEEGLVSVLAEPNLTAMSGETATFLAGGEFPIPVAQDNDTITIEFREFGVRLEFTPTILDEGRISLQVAPEVSELNFADGVSLGSNNIRVPALSTRRTATTVELASGQSFAVAGLLQNTQNHSVSKLPGLGDVPVLGALFRSNAFRRGETELAIVITPYVVEPVESARMSLPTDSVSPPNDIERLFFGRMYGARAAERQAAAARLGDRRLHGPVGFVLE